MKSKSVYGMMFRLIYACLDWFDGRDKDMTSIVSENQTLPISVLLLIK